MQIARAYAEGGADLIELGVPFSDPLADGPVIHAAGTAALRAGATVDAVLEVGRAISERVPVVVMCYANPIFARGAERFADALVEAGASGLIVPDLPLEEGAGCSGRASSAGSRWCRWSRRRRPRSGWRGSRGRPAGSCTRSR